VSPLQIGLFVVIVGVVGVAFTVATVVAVSEQLFTVAITVYVPLLAVVAFSMLGFCVLDVYELGPVQL
jgi:hypothetical protein